MSFKSVILRDFLELRMKAPEGYCQLIIPHKCDKCDSYEAYIQLYTTDTEQRNSITSENLCLDCLKEVGRSDILLDEVDESGRTDSHPRSV